MSGTVHSKAYRIATVPARYRIFGVFWALNDYMASHPGFQRIAFYTGSIANGGPGKPYENGVDNKAFSVWRALSSSIITSASNPTASPRFDFCMNVTYDTFTNSDPLNTTSQLNYGISVAMAHHSSSVAWSGSINNNGNDTFNSTGANGLWYAGSNVFPRSNGVGGDNVTTKNAFCNITSTNSLNDPLVICTGDNDTLVFTVYPDGADSGNYLTFGNMVVFGGYERASTNYNLPLMMAVNPVRDENIGSTTIGSDTGGISTTISGSCRVLRMDLPPLTSTLLGVATFKKESITSVTEFPISLFQYETGHYRPAGYLTSMLRATHKTARPFAVFRSGSEYRTIISSYDWSKNAFTIPWASSSIEFVEV